MVDLESICEGRKARRVSNCRFASSSLRLEAIVNDVRFVPKADIWLGYSNTSLTAANSNCGLAAVKVLRKIEGRSQELNIIYPAPELRAECPRPLPR